MIVIWGKRLFGKCDQVKGVCFTATQFFHIQFVPLVPLKSFLVVQGSEKDNNFNGVEIPLSMRSAFFGWLRAGLVIGGLVGMIAAADNGVNVFLPPVFCAIAFGLTYLVSRANEARAQECRGLLGIREAAVPPSIEPR